MKELKTLIGIIEYLDPNNQDNFLYRISGIVPCEPDDEEFAWPQRCTPNLLPEVSANSLLDLCKEFLKWSENRSKEYIYIINWNIKLDRCTVQNDISEPLCRVRTFWPEEVEKFYNYVYKIVNGK